MCIQRLGGLVVFVIATLCHCVSAKPPWERLGDIHVDVPRVEIPNLDDLRRKAQDAIDEFHRLKRDVEALYSRVEEARRLVSMDNQEMRREGYHRLRQMGVIGSNRDSILAGLRSGVGVFIPAAEFDHVEEANLAKAVGQSVAAVNPGPVYVYLQQFLIESKRTFLSNLQNAPADVRERLATEFEMQILRALDEAFHGRAPQPFVVHGVVARVGVATFNNWVDIRYKEPELINADKILGVQLYRVGMQDRIKQIPLPNTFLPYVKLELRVAPSSNIPNNPPPPSPATITGRFRMASGSVWVDNRNGTWTEFHPRGPIQFREVHRTPTSVGLFDPARNMHIQLVPEFGLIWDQTRRQWTRFDHSEGRWE